MKVQNGFQTVSDFLSVKPHWKLKIIPQFLNGEKVKV